MKKAVKPRTPARPPQGARKKGALLALKNAVALKKIARQRRSLQRFNRLKDPRLLLGGVEKAALLPDLHITRARHPRTGKTVWCVRIHYTESTRGALQEMREVLRHLKEHHVLNPRSRVRFFNRDALIEDIHGLRALIEERLAAAPRTLYTDTRPDAASLYQGLLQEIEEAIRRRRLRALFKE